MTAGPAPELAPEPFRCQVRVRFGECDMQGVVFNAHYLAYIDDAAATLTAFAEREC